MATNPTDQDGGGKKIVNLAELFQFREMRLKLEALLSNTDIKASNDPKIAVSHQPLPFWTTSHTQEPKETPKSENDNDETPKP